MVKRQTNTGEGEGNKIPSASVKSRPSDLKNGQTTDTPRALIFAQNGIRTGQDFAALMSALMSDIIEGRIDAITANAACNAGGKLLKVVEMQYRLAAMGAQPHKPLMLIGKDQQEE